MKDFFSNSSRGFTFAPLRGSSNFFVASSSKFSEPLRSPRKKLVNSTSLRFQAFFLFLPTLPRFVSVRLPPLNSASGFTQTPLHTNERFTLRYRYVLQRSFFAYAFCLHFKPLQFSPRSTALRVPFISAAFRSPRFPLLSFRHFGLSATFRFATGTPLSYVPSFIQPKALPTRSGPLSRPRLG